MMEEKHRRKIDKVGKRSLASMAAVGVIENLRYSRWDFWSGRELRRLQTVGR